MAFRTGRPGLHIGLTHARARGRSMAAHNGMYHQMRLPDRLPWPSIYLAREQTDVLSKPELRGVREYIDNLELREDDCLPAWVPHRVVAKSLGLGTDGITKATAWAAGTPYVWATEFENVHDLWTFTEPCITVDSKAYPSAEAYYQAQKPEPFDKDEWNKVKVEVMYKAIRVTHLRTYWTQVATLSAQIIAVIVLLAIALIVFVQFIIPAA